jgi:DnaK suppressor protein
MKSLTNAPFRKLLLRERAQLLQQLVHQRGGDSRVGAATVHLRQGEDSHAQVLSEREVEMILDDRETAELDAIDAALKRIQEGRYGICTECGAEISVARLKAAPRASRCIACQTRYEQTHPAS